MKKDTVLFILASALCIICIGIHNISKSINIDSSNIEKDNPSNKGYVAHIDCIFGMIGGYAQVPVQSCATNSEIIIVNSNHSRQSYNEYRIPDTIYLPSHFRMSIWNGSDKYTFVIKIIDSGTNSVVAVREIGPTSYDIVQN